MKTTRLKSLLIISFIMLCYTNGRTQDFWEALNTPNGIAIRSITINDVGQIFLGVGNNNTPGGVYRSDDAGDTWNLVFDNGDFTVDPIEINPHGDIYIGKRGFDPLKVSYNNGDTWDSLFYPGLGNITAMYSSGQDTLFVNSMDGPGAFLVRTYNNGDTWDTVFTTNNSTEYIKDILQTQSGDIYIALTGYFPDMGGVYKSIDGGDNWEYSGLFNYMVSSLAENSEGDIFASVRGILQSGLLPGLYVLRNGGDEWEELLAGPFVEDVVVNSADHIYLTSGGVLRSLNNGQTFEYVSEGLPPGPRGLMTIDELDYIYVIAEYSSHSLHRTVNPTVSINENEIQAQQDQALILYPNPAGEYLFVKNPVEGDVQYNIRIYNELGLLVLQTKKDIDFNQVMLNIGSLKPGFYFLEIYSDKTKRNGRFIKY